MPLLDRPGWSYREDPEVPGFDDSRPLFLFDGICVLCSRGAAFIMRSDRKRRIALASAQSELGSALYRHYGIGLDESYLFLADGRAFTKSDGYFRLFRELGGPWRLLNVCRLVPRALRDWLYDRIAANRYRWFGQSSYCGLLSPEQRERLIDR